tara:strand:- start:145 stop:2478 length:2334 start_codon:yes stop_codon:yes gene_type:complete
MQNSFTPVEKYFFDLQDLKDQKTSIPYITVADYPSLGLLTSLRFLEWVFENPYGVVSLPTGKTPEYFIKWTKKFLSNWDNEKLIKIRIEHGLKEKNKPDFSNLTFVQIDEFFPINSKQHNSFYNYVNKYYLENFSFSKEKALLINCDSIPLYDGMSAQEIFLDNPIDLTLRHRDPSSKIEEKQQKSIFLIDQWCSNYEHQIQDLGGLGFFLGGIGPDGHIAFNIRGSDHNSTTRLMETNFETQAAAATDLGGIEISKRHLVITIGLGTITFNKDATSIITAAGEAKAKIIRDSIESSPSTNFPATALNRINNSRFYITEGAAKELTDVQNFFWQKNEWSNSKQEKALLLCAKKNKAFAKKLKITDLEKDLICKDIPNLNKDTVELIISNIKEKINKGLQHEKNQTFYHTGPHHDDIMLGMMPHVMHLMREKSNTHHFVNMTSGFTSVTNGYLIEVLESTLDLLKRNKIEMIEYANFFNEGFNLKQDKDVYHYLDALAQNNIEEQKRALAHRIVRCFIKIFNVNKIVGLAETVSLVKTELNNYYDGQKNSSDIQKLKGMLREYEEELVWSNFGVQGTNVHHLRLGFYSGDVFTEDPTRDRDVFPILEQLRIIKPTVISLALDPEGSGPDTHYKVLQSIASAVRIWSKETNLDNLRIWGYRNVWYRFDQSESNLIVPVTLNTMSVMKSIFLNSYLSQKNASFPSHELNGPFCDLSQKIWVEQHQDLQILLGRDFWYEHENPQLRAVHGAIYLKELNVENFLGIARRLQNFVDGNPVNIN